jgi:hypothetical protein
MYYFVYFALNRCRHGKCVLKLIELCCYDIYLFVFPLEAKVGIRVMG